MREARPPAALRLKALAREQASLADRRSELARLVQARTLLAQTGTDAELRALAEAEVREAEAALARLAAQAEAAGASGAAAAGDGAQIARGAVVEIRAGAGGDEAALFAGVLERMYRKYAEAQGWGWEAVDAQHNDLGGLREGVFRLERGFRTLQHESGVHRVQRVPATEASGRIHTSTATVAVLPEAGEEELRIDSRELRIDTYRAGGAGGQHVNRTDSAVRITHLPSGITAQCQDEKSQHRNKARAMAVLRARLQDARRAEQEAKTRRLRRGQIGTGDRSERIRTYNYPQNRVTDHRIGFTLRRLDAVLEGELAELLAALEKAKVEAEAAAETSEGPDGGA